MTVLTLRAELALVEIRMAIRAARAGLGKDFRYVARITSYILVHAAKLKVSFGIVIELEPAGEAVTNWWWCDNSDMEARASHAGLATFDLCYRRQCHPLALPPSGLSISRPFPRSFPAAPKYWRDVHH